MLYSCRLVFLWVCGHSAPWLFRRDPGPCFSSVREKVALKVLKHTARDKGTRESVLASLACTQLRLFYTPQIGSSSIPLLFPSARLDSLLTPQVQRSQLGLSWAQRKTFLSQLCLPHGATRNWLYFKEKNGQPGFVWLVPAVQKMGTWESESVENSSHSSLSEKVPLSWVFLPHRGFAGL